jgi:hypothetical protein
VGKIVSRNIVKSRLFFRGRLFLFFTVWRFVHGKALARLSPPLDYEPPRPGALPWLLPRPHNSALVDHDHQPPGFHRTGYDWLELGRVLVLAGHLTFRTGRDEVTDDGPHFVGVKRMLENPGLRMTPTERTWVLGLLDDATDYLPLSFVHFPPSLCGLRELRELRELRDFPTLFSIGTIYIPFWNIYCSHVG